MTGHQCGSCHWFDKDAYFADPDDPPEEQIGQCNWPPERLPYSLRYGNRERVAVGPLDGKECPCFTSSDT